MWVSSNYVYAAAAALLVLELFMIREKSGRAHSQTHTQQLSSHYYSQLHATENKCIDCNYIVFFCGKRQMPFCSPFVRRQHSFAVALVVVVVALPCFRHRQQSSTIRDVRRQCGGGCTVVLLCLLSTVNVEIAGKSMRVKAKQNHK